MSQVTLGGERLGSGNKQKVSMRNYERSTHDLSYVWRSTMASGTLVPFMTEVALPGDSFDIDLNVDIKTHPTIGPLFGSYKVQLDVFQCPIRLYNGKLHMNMLNIGMNMAQIKLPQLELKAEGNENAYGDNEQINPSSIFSYLNIRGLGTKETGVGEISRQFNGIPYLAYWDIYKNYYANKQEEIGAVIHNPMNYIGNNITVFNLLDGTNTVALSDDPTGTPVTMEVVQANVTYESTDEPDASKIILYYNDESGHKLPILFTEYFETVTWFPTYKLLRGETPTFAEEIEWLYYKNEGSVINPENLKPQITTFPLSNIDTMREEILQNTMDVSAFLINETSEAPYGLPMVKGDYTPKPYSKQSSQEGLGLKTYQSDLFNNWISTEWIDGDNGINAITAIDTSSGEFTIDTLQLSKKVYDMLNRIAVSGGTYDDWLDAVYTHERTRSVENPMYMGGLIQELAFQEVVSNAAAAAGDTEQPLGTLAGRGILTQKKKGGKIKVRVDEPSYIMGIISLTPRIDYSQGNKWDTNLKTMDDFHKPALDEIGFQDLVTDQMAWFDTKIVDGEPVFKSAGKQPAWINYMTNVNAVRGNFAEKKEQMWMTLNRGYQQGAEGIEDLTTYIDPTKFNQIFADTRLDAQNFWAQIGVNIEARRKMSAKLMPNL